MEGNGAGENGIGQIGSVVPDLVDSGQQGKSDTAVIVEHCGQCEGGNTV